LRGGGGFSGGGIARGGSNFRGNVIVRGGGTRFVNNTRYLGGRFYYPSSYYYPSFYLGLGYGGYPYSYGYDPYYYEPYSYGDPYDSGYVGYAPPAPPVPPQPPAVINQNIGTPSGSFYRAADFYLIAFTDHTIRAALSYTAEGDQIRYTTREHEERTAPLSDVDLRFSEQINRDRRVEFKLP
jgi:hypothetical protein